MKALKRTIVVLALGAVAGGCTTLNMQSVGREDLKNTQGHVIGYKQTMRDAGTGELLTQIALFVPRLGERGQVIGYEERLRSGSVFHDLYGKRVGGNWIDLRSRGTNPNNRGLTIIVYGKPAERLAVAEAPTIDDLVRLAGLTN